MLHKNKEEGLQLLTQSSIAHCESLNGLSSIRADEFNAVLWTRGLKRLTQQALQLLTRMDDISVTDSASQIIHMLEYHPELSRFADLQHDIAMLVKQFSAISGSETVRLTLTTVNTDMCRRFHTDLNELRLLCTYTGPGTLILPEDAADRKALQFSGDNDRIVRDPDAIVRAGETDVVILKGALYPKDGVQAAIHCSPTIEETGKQRLLLRIDSNNLRFE